MSCLVVHAHLSVVVLIIKVLTLVILDHPLSIFDTNLKSHKLLYYNCACTLFYILQSINLISILSDG